MSFGETKHQKIVIFDHVGGHRAFREQQLACVKGLFDLGRIVEIIGDIGAPSEHTLIIALEEIVVLYFV